MYVSSWYIVVILFILLDLILTTRSVQISQDRRNNDNNNINNSSIILRRRQSNDLPSSSMVIGGDHTAVSINRIDLVLLISNQNELPISYEILKPTLEMAIQDAAKKYPHLQFYLNPVYDDNICQSNVLGALAAEKYYTGHVSAFIGPICSLALDPVSRMASYWNVPVFTAGGISYEFSYKKIFTTLTRISFSLDRVSHFFFKIFQVYGWQHISLIVDETELANKLVRISLQSIFKEAEFGYEIFLESITYERKLPNVTIDYQKMLRQASRSARVIILVTNGENTRDIMIEAHSLGMGGGEYVFFGIELLKTNKESADFSWYKAGDRKNKIAKEMYESLMIMAIRVPVSPEYTSFVHKVTKLSSEEFGRMANHDDVNPVVAAFYDCVFMYAWAYNYTLAKGGDVTDGRSLIRGALWDRTFPDALTGDILINQNGDREVDYTLNDLDPETGTMRPVATYFGARRIFDKFAGVEIHWPKEYGPAPDVPDCGFTGDAPHCIKHEGFPIWASILITFFVVILLTLIISFFAYKKIKMEQDLNDNWWRVVYEDIIFPNQAKSGAKSALSLASDNDGYQSGKASSLRIGSIGHSLLSAAGELDTVHVGIYKGLKIAFKPLQIKKLAMSRQLLVEIKQMRDLTHENLTRFIGICPDEPNYGVVNELMIRGSLHDLLETEKIQIDWTFKYSMMTDIVEGMLFLQNSTLEYHGHLKSTNCVVDGRFMVKITDYGLRTLHAQITREHDLNSKALFWTAPEHLRSKDPLNSGSKKGDIYAFAIILQEIITRSPPFESLERLGRKKKTYQPDEILDRVRMGTVPPFRPEVAPDEASKELLTLMQECWDEHPNNRPDFIVIKQKLRRITRGISSRNFLDNLLNRMEQYSQNLERIVEEKTQSVIEEKQKTEELLYQLLPRFIAEELKRGSHVKPESFESVTIFFSDIVGFTLLSAESSPLQVVDLLNDLYTCFDAIIDIHDVYKVETIGDAYMVASGLPIRNGNDHAKEIAMLALNLKKAVSGFKIRHSPKKRLQIRIGIHSGPCVAGVVGLKMPKYCLFGEPQRIHISENTKKLLDTFGCFTIIPRGEVEVKGKGVMVTYWLESGRRAGGVGGVGSIGSQQTSSIGNQSSFNELEKDVPIQDEFRQSAKHRTEYSSFNDHNNNNTNTNIPISESIANIE
ncbi:Nitrogen permease regulator 2 [Dermatophagoides farinae]|uniref:guanylate cyclase n=1 Tax=Dermatophagoides farinae TaxID=6954 RepID=A0A922HNC8_DERFA|nr:Nitrogen permease regulator 2 [Dermatophagoides farinae]